MREPRLLLLDEPFAALDALTRIRMHALALELWRAHGPTTLIVTHDVDEAVLLADRVLVLDYKTNRPPPATPGEVAPLYLRQMAAYRAVLRQAFPGRAVDCALVWTYGARLMPLPGELLDAHLPASAA